MKKSMRAVSFIIITAFLLTMLIPAALPAGASENTTIRFIINRPSEQPYFFAKHESTGMPNNLRLTAGTGTDGENIPENYNYITDLDWYVTYKFDIGPNDVSALVSVPIGNRYMVEASKNNRVWTEIAKVTQISDQTESNRNMFRRVFDLSPVLAGDPGGTIYLRFSNSFPDGGHGANIGGEMAFFSSPTPFTIKPGAEIIPEGRPIHAVENLADLVVFTSGTNQTGSSAGQTSGTSTGSSQSGDAASRTGDNGLFVVLVLASVGLALSVYLIKGKKIKIK